MNQKPQKKTIQEVVRAGRAVKKAKPEKSAPRKKATQKKKAARPKIAVKSVADIVPISETKEGIDYKRKPGGKFAVGNKGGKGGFRPGSGRKSKLSQQYHDRKLDKVLKNAWRFIHEALDPDVPAQRWLEGFDERWKVIKYVIDRAHGRPRQTMQIQTDGFDTLGEGQVDIMVAAYITAQARSAARTAGPAGPEYQADIQSGGEYTGEDETEDFYTARGSASGRDSEYHSSEGG